MGLATSAQRWIVQPAVISALRELLGDRAVTSASVRDHHAQGEGLRTAAPPDIVVFPLHTGEVAAIARICNQHLVPLIAFGAGTSLEGHVQAIHGGVTVSLARMDRILAVSAGDLDCQIEAGTTLSGLNRHLRDQGLFFPIDPGSDPTLGGMAATRASGTNAVRYGTMRDAVLGLTVVTAAGEVIHTGGRARKSSAGYDLTRLYVGSEGTLGIITELRLRLFAVPEETAAASCQFETLAGAVGAASSVMQHAIPIARIELLDELQMRACIRYSDLQGFAEKPTLFLEFHGTKASVQEQVELVQAITDEHGGSSYRWAVRAEDRNEMWRARHAAYHASMALSPGAQGFSTDTCVPITELANCVLEGQRLAQASGLLCTIVGHVGDGNFHVLILHDPNDAGESARAEKLAQDISLLAISVGGTCTGEHGIGMHKMELLRIEHGAGVDVMRAIKATLDPNGILNPGKVIPAAL